MLVGIRDRLRCPKCKAVGTWKPHGGWLDNFVAWKWNFAAMLPAGVGVLTARRWVCKYCGYVRNKDGEFQAYPNSVKKVWYQKDENSTPTPKERVGELNPWAG